MKKKSAKNVVEEWVKQIRDNAYIAYNAESKSTKHEYLKQIIGNCDTILATLDCCDDEE